MLIMKYAKLVLSTMALCASLSLSVTVGIAHPPPSPSEDPFLEKQAIEPSMVKSSVLEDSAPGNHEGKEEIDEEYKKGFTKISFKDIVGNKGYESFLLSDPPRLVLDVLQPTREPSFRKRALKGEAFHRLRVGQYPDKVRFVLDFRQGERQEPSVTKDGGDLIVLVVSSEPAPDPGFPSEVLVEEALGENEGGTDGRSTTTIRNTVALYVGGLQHLYNKELRRDPTLCGKVTVTFEIAPSGHVTETALVSSSISSKSLVQAILNSIKNWKFPGVSEEYGNVRVTYPFAFVIRSL